MAAANNVFRVDGKVALVTGAARGIGAEIALALANAGAAVLVTDLADAGDTVAKIKAAGGKAAALKHNVTVEAEWEAAVAAAKREFGSLDIVVNNAGIETAALIANCTLEDFSNVMNINVNGVFLGVKHAIRAMAKPNGNGGVIVNMSSVAGLIGTTGHVAYHASKGAVRLLTKAAAIECAQLQTGVRVNSVHPAIVQTEMGANFMQHLVDLGLAPDYASAEAAVKAMHPIGHFGEPADVANGVVYLASDAGKWVTGSELVIDGGLTAI
ncbi:MAG: glucose 1-dehydrogenase [Rudaea sp.]|uniref:glucose 1-dehydrogenase n=1 Tax=unclassified Rudaea TaxID=2627037 RepID=UPI0014855F11|nr:MULTISPECIES: glucose 1-dehydrogenase [unclassified Rudaea]MBN8887106.1 glucose 1-dehydrogenase [Rudaea sp.]